MRQIRGVLKSQRWATFPMVLKGSSTGGDPVSWFPRTERGHSLALLLTSPALPLSQTNSREKELRFRVVCHADVKEGRRWDWLARYRVQWREGRRGRPLSYSFLIGKNFKLVQPSELKLQPWGYRQVSFFYEMLSFCVQKELLIIWIKEGQWIQETIRCMRVLGTDLRLGCL